MVDMNPRAWQKFSAPSLLRNVPEIFCFSFIMRISRSAWLLVKGTVKSNCLLFFCGIYRGFYLDQEVVQSFAPPLPIVLRDPPEFAQEVGITDGMITGIPEVWRPEVMDHRSLECGQGSHGNGCLRSSFPMAPVGGEAIGTGDMQPMPGAGHPHAGFIDMENLHILQEVSGRTFDLSQVSRALAGGCNHGCLTQQVPEEVKNHLGGSLIVKRSFGWAE